MIEENTRSSMAGIEFDRQAFVQAAQDRKNSIIPVLGLVGGIVVLCLVGYLGYKMIASYSPAVAATQPVALDQIQQQLSDIDKRLDELEKHRRAVAAEPVVAPAPKTAVAAAAPRAGYKVKGASALAPQTIPTRDPSLATKSYVEQQAAAISAESAANHEAWQATTDRLADVVGVVGTQQGEISHTREDVNRLLSTTVRSAMPFELRRGAAREPVGPVSLVLKNADTKAQRYTVCIYVDDQCVELKNRAVNEVVSFVLKQNTPPLEFVATRILHDQIVGYLQVPGANH
jgi:hypothetical protein